jgi:hypothetical protein
VNACALTIHCTDERGHSPQKLLTCANQRGLSQAQVVSGRAERAYSGEKKAISPSAMAEFLQLAARPIGSGQVISGRGEGGAAR